MSGIINFNLSQVFISKERAKVDKKTGEVKIIVAKNGIESYLKSDTKIDSKLLALFTNTSKYSKNKNFKRVQMRNHILAEKCDATVNGIQKAIARLEKLGFIYRTFYIGKMRNIHLNLNYITQVAGICDLKKDLEFNKKTEDDKGRVKVKHGGFSRLDITRRRIMKDFFFYDERILDNKKKKRGFLERLKRIQKRGKFAIQEDALKEYRDLNLDKKEKEIDARFKWDTNLNITIDLKREIIDFTSRWRP